MIKSLEELKNKLMEISQEKKWDVRNFSADCEGDFEFWGASVFAIKSIIDRIYRYKAFIDGSTKDFEEIICIEIDPTGFIEIDPSGPTEKLSKTAFAIAPRDLKPGTYTWQSKTAFAIVPRPSIAHSNVLILAGTEDKIRKLLDPLL